MSGSRPVGTKGVPRAQREQLILDAATIEFGRFGYAGATLSAVAAQAGVSKPLVLSYFGSKDGLYSACMQRAGANLIDHIEAVLTTRQSPPQMAEDTLTAIFQALAPPPAPPPLAGHRFGHLRSVPAGGRRHLRDRPGRPLPGELPAARSR